MRLILTNIIMQHTSHLKRLQCRLLVAQGPSHYHHGDSRAPLRLWDNRARWKSVTLQLHPNFHSVSVMFLDWNCLSGLAPLKPLIVLRPVRGWAVGFTCHSSCLTHPPAKTAHRKNSESRFTPGMFSACVVIASLAPEAGCYDSDAYPHHRWKCHWQIIARQCIGRCQHIGLADTHTCTNTSASLCFHACGDLLD